MQTVEWRVYCYPRRHVEQSQVSQRKSMEIMDIIRLAKGGRSIRILSRFLFWSPIQGSPVALLCTKMKY